MEDEAIKKNSIEITIELVDRIVKWDKKNKRLDAHKYLFMVELLEGKKKLTDRNKALVSYNLKTVQRFGFK